MALDAARIRTSVDERWDRDVLGPLQDYMRIPNVSPAFDPAWEANGHMAAATELVRRWCESRPVADMRVEVLEVEGRTPVVLCEIPATDPSLADDTVLLYGHLDKQPEMTGWREGLGPWEPVLEGDLLYGRGGADDGYAVFSAFTAIEALHDAGGAHARLLVLIEASEESGSPDLPAHLDALGDRLGPVSLVVGLDSGAADYDRLWVTTSLRGVLVAAVRVDVLEEGMHSGAVGGVVPSSFRILRRLLDRIEDSDTGRVLVEELWCELPAERQAQMEATAAQIVDGMALPWAGRTRADHADAVSLLRARTWEPSVATIAVDGFPPADRAGNVLRPFSEVTLSCRLAPAADPMAAAAALERTLTADPPNGATVTVTVPGAGSNAHGPDEFLHLPMARRVTAAVSHVLDAHARR